MCGCVCVCVCVDVNQSGTNRNCCTCKETCNRACTDLLTNPHRMPKIMSVWPTLQLKIARRKKWACIGTFNPAEPHSQLLVWSGAVYRVNKDDYSQYMLQIYTQITCSHSFVARLRQTTLLGSDSRDHISGLSRQLWTWPALLLLHPQSVQSPADNSFPDVCY